MTILLKEEKNKASVLEFYRLWLNARKIPNFLPITPGIILGYLYVGILYTKEIWFDLIPDVRINESGPEWILNTYIPECPKNSTPTLKYVIRRIRNSLGHGTVKTILPENLSGRDRLKNIKIEFFDTNSKDELDTFKIIIRLVDLQEFVRQFQSIIVDKIRNE